MSNNKKVILAILDGWGHGKKNNSNAIYKAHTPFTDSLYTKYPNAELRTDGENVGLPEGQMGNSEVGHTNIGAGRIVYQDLVKINIEIRLGSFYKNETLLKAMSLAKEKNRKLHFMGLLSDGGVHSHINHLSALCNMAKDHGLQNVFVHAFMDGRDTDPKSGIHYLHQLEEHIKNGPVKIASLIGRYYAMDRDQRWERIKKCYDLLTKGTGNPFNNAEAAIKDSYKNGITDEFVEPACMTDGSGKPMATITEDDVVICFNYRTDRCREITQALTQTDFSEFGMHTMPLHYFTMTNYDESYQHVHVIYDKDNLAMTLGEVLSNEHKTQIRIAETEKYPHVTFFFSGGREKPFDGESRIMVPSPKVATYDLQPEMSAREIAEKICSAIENEAPAFVCLNFANPDMVGHTGVFDAIVKAVETTDQALQKVVETGLKHNYSIIIIADHGNADMAINDDGSPNTAHTTNPVPIWILDPDVRNIESGVLADVAPTILKIMNIEQPSDMSGRALC